VEPWQVQLSAGNVHTAWDLFIEHYRLLILKTIRHTLSDSDEVMDAFVDVCEMLGAQSLARLKAFDEQSAQTARFPAWLVVVVRNSTVDWLRKRYGRPRVRIPDSLSDLERRIFELVFVVGASRLEAYERVRAGGWQDISFSSFLKALRNVYRVRGSRGASVPRCTAEAADDPFVDDAPLADQLVMASERKVLVRKALESLDPQDRLAVQLFVIDELPAAEVARTLGWRNSKAVYNRVYRAMATLRALLQHEGIESTKT
jgi:RNA polymerase sigma factor (sigma-70 family)